MRRVLVKMGIFLFIGLFIVYSLTPVYIVIITSLKSSPELFRNILALPSKCHWENYTKVWIEDNFRIYFKNSIIISLPSMFLVLLCSSLGGYAFAKMEFRGRRMIFFILLMGIMLPVPSIIIPLYYNLDRFGLLNTRLGVILVETSITIPFGVFLMRTFFRGIPDELLEAAQIDGATKFQALIKIFLPLAQPGIKALALISFMWAWQRYLLALVIITDLDLAPLTRAMDIFQGRYMTAHTLLATAAVITFLPITLVYLVSQKTFIKGLTMGALKG